MSDVTCQVRAAPLVRPFQVSHTTVTEVTEVTVRASVRGVTGTGTVALGPWRPDDAATVAELAQDLILQVTEGAVDLIRVVSTLAPWRFRAPAASQLAEMCLLDLVSRAYERPLWQVLDLPRPSDRIPLLQTLSLGEGPAPASITDTRLKVKMGGPGDDDVLDALVASQHEAMIDVNRGWTRANLARFAPRLRSVRLLAVEDPVQDPNLLPIVRTELPGVPILLDEGIESLRAVEAALEVGDGVNIKLLKFGGLLPAVDAARRARRQGGRIMLGCFIEPAVCIGYAATMSGLADWCDLDGHTWLSGQWSRHWLDVDVTSAGAVGRSSTSRP